MLRTYSVNLPRIWLKDASTSSTSLHALSVLSTRAYTTNRVSREITARTSYSTKKTQTSTRTRHLLESRWNSTNATKATANSDVQTTFDDVPPPKEKEGLLYIDTIFPIQFGLWDIRYYLALSQKFNVTDQIRATLAKVKIPGFKVESIEPRIKDGGVFVKFKYLQFPQTQARSKDSSTTTSSTETGADTTTKASLKANTSADSKALSTDPPDPADLLEAEIKKQVNEAGGIRGWYGRMQGEVWLVRGKPWREDMRRYAAPTIKVYFEGPDIYQETLYALLRPYGQISDITNPVPVPAGNLRFSTVKFASMRGAVRAHNCIHGFTLVDEPAVSGQSSSAKPTRLASVYERNIRMQNVKDWMGSHPRIVIPIIVFLLGTLSYIVFDPIRTVVVQAKVMEWLEFKEFRIVKWLKRNTVDRLTVFRSASSSSKSPATSGAPESLWKDRKEAEHSLRTYLSEAPSTIAFVHGPQGSGKTSMLNRALSGKDRHVLVIDCEILNKGKSDADVINGLAEQTGYWPVFTWLNNFTNLIDLASVGLIGQKSGLSTSIETQQKNILGIVGDALKGISVRHKEIQKTKQIAKAIKEETAAEFHKVEKGGYEGHDPRIDAVSGTGVISELGVGDEKMTEKDKDKLKDVKSNQASQAVDKAVDASGKAVVKGQQAVESGKDAVKSTDKGKDKTESSQSQDDAQSDKTSSKKWGGTVVGTAVGAVSAVQGVAKEAKQGAEKIITGAKDQLGIAPGGPLDLEAHGHHHHHNKNKQHNEQYYAEKAQLDEEIRALPVVVIKNYATKSTFTDELVVVLAEWAAGLADSGTAHVVVMSDNRDNGRKLAKALPSKPLTSIALEDADPASALSFVGDRLTQYGVKSVLSAEQKVQIGRLGGRSSDLEALCHKVKNGMPVEMAVEDIIARGIGELRKNAFGEEIEDAKSLAWSKEQVYFILKSLAKTDEIPYYDTLLDFPFKGDEASLRGMEHAELISITTQEGRPSTIRPGRPVYRFVFERLVNDPTFRSVQEIALNEKAITSAESTIKSCEAELLQLRQIKGLDSGVLSSGATSRRINFLLKKLDEAEVKLEGLEAKNTALKKGLKQP